MHAWLLSLTAKLQWCQDSNLSGTLDIASKKSTSHMQFGNKILFFWPYWFTYTRQTWTKKKTCSGVFVLQDQHNGCNWVLGFEWTLQNHGVFQHNGFKTNVQLLYIIYTLLVICRSNDNECKSGVYFHYVIYTLFSSLIIVHNFLFPSPCILRRFLYAFGVTCWGRVVNSSAMY